MAWSGLYMQRSQGFIQHFLHLSRNVAQEASRSPTLEGPGAINIAGLQQIYVVAGKTSYMLSVACLHT